MARGDETQTIARQQTITRERNFSSAAAATSDLRLEERGMVTGDGKLVEEAKDVVKIGFGLITVAPQAGGATTPTEETEYAECEASRLDFGMEGDMRQRRLPGGVGCSLDRFPALS
ncbi:hypothetical protein MKZ38_010156 [Zalerion maritima]|uniref:Uncharacterized protein n=1 Tax=Zalerion maritima TaxID=339359 RepID=A0AAD5RU68_9PEZI|nr:hypothetical protein MKZ38_010156 [Zalerion maritima]